MCGQTHLQIVSLSREQQVARSDALLVMEIEVCAENPQGQVTSGMFNVLFANLGGIIRSSCAFWGGGQTVMRRLLCWPFSVCHNAKLKLISIVMKTSLA